MALSIVNNVSSLNAQQNLNKTSSALSKSLERLSTGLKVNRGADGPATLVISEQQRAQIAGLTTAIDNTNKAVSVVQTAEGALNEVNGLLTKIRGLALDSANSGVNDANALAANQAEIANALATIDSISSRTKFGSKTLLDGSAGINATLNVANAAGVKSLTAGTGVAAGTYTVAITTQGTGGSLVGAASNGNALTAAGSLSITGGGLTSAVSVSLDVGDNASTSAGKIQKALDAATAQGGGSGKFVVTVGSGATPAITIKSNVIGVTNSPAIAVANVGGTGTELADVVALSTGTGAAGTDAVVTITDPNAAVTTLTASAGPNGLYNQYSYGGTSGLNFALSVASGQTNAASNSTITVADNSLVFQIGANQNETAKVSIDNVASNKLAVGVFGLSSAATTDLSKIDITTAAGAQDAIKVVDAAVNQISTIRGRLGAFQANTLESNARNLSATLSNTTAAESVIRDTDFASEIANYTKLSTQIQAGSTVLANANQSSQLVAQLLRG